MALLSAAPAWSQDLGHKVPGTLGLNAGRQQEPGFYVADQLVFYSADRLRDGKGDVLPVVGLRLRALANGVGLSYTLRWRALFLNWAVSAPVAHVHLESDLPQASIDKYGLGDGRVQPLGLGWRTDRLELVASYALYFPTGRFAPGGRGGLSRGSFSHEFSLGGTVFFDRSRNWFFTALASYELNQRKIGVDITRGDTIQIQGGMGRQSLLGMFDVGVAAYALWQVRDDRGGALPPALRGNRDRVLGLGPEIGVRIRPIRTRLSLRYGHDFAVRARPEGQIVVLTAALQLFRPGP
jgi:hypothetical protein